ncbi:MAG: ABC transporter substrate-binding protein [Chloroflexi bacterium]|nr:ABC transporter substrate-binding protein [Chloroflexota bacterium]
MKLGSDVLVGLLLSGAVLTACAAPAPTATPTQSSAVAPTATKAPTATPTKRPLTKVSFSQSTSGFTFIPNYIVFDRFGKEEGLDIEMVLSGGGSKTRAAVGAGDPPFGTSNSNEVIPAVAKGLPIQLILALFYGSPYQIIVRKDVAGRLGITEKSLLADRLKALNGLTFSATSAGSDTDNRLRQVISKAGYNPDRDTTITYIGDFPQMVAALEAGSIDGFISSPPDSLVQVGKGKAVILANLLGPDFPEFSNIMGSGVIANKGYLEKNPEVATAMVRAFWKAQKLVVDDPATAKNIVYKAAFQETDRALFDQSFDFFKPALAKEPTLRQDALKAVLDGLNAGKAPADQINIAFDAYATNRYVDEAKRQLGF